VSKYDLIVVKGRLVIPGQTIIRADLGIKGGKIVCISERLAQGDTERIIEAEGKYVFPGLIDPHVHIGLHLPFLQDLRTESKAAAAGGVTTMLTTLASLDKLIDFYSPKPPIKTETVIACKYSELLPRVEKQTKGFSTVDFCLRPIIGNKNHVDEIETCYRQFGVKSYKFFTAYKDRADITGIDDGLIYYLLKTIGEIEPPPIPQVHCENHEIIEFTTEEAKNSGMGGLSAWNAARPNVTEEEVIAKVCLLARHTGSPIYIVHVSTSEGVNVIKEEQQKGTHVIAETCVHYLCLTEEREGVCGKIVPPLRKRKDVEALWEGIRSGVITCVGTDHVSRDKTEQNGGDIWTAFAAWPSMEILLPAMVTESRKRETSLLSIAEVCSLNVAKTFGLFPKKGSIAVGSDADLVIVDLENERKVDAKRFHSIGKYCPYDGMTFFGWPELTILRGKVVFDKGEFSEPIGKHIRVGPGGIF